ncbi:MAG: hypothetical protein LC679_08695 [Intrasporangiaceae bacterium]|nr:hypothetical protein [Intrasporangiaceae bacterium]
MSGGTLEQLADDRGLTMDDVAEALRTLPRPDGGRLTTHELQVLGDLGIDPDATSRTPLAAGVLRRRQLEQASLTTEQVATLLARQTSRIRQRLSGPERSLLGFHRPSGRREWLLPAFQFELGLHDHDGWARLLQQLPPADETSPLTLLAWLTDPQDHLDGRSRVETLAAGERLDPLLAEARSFGVLA